MQSNLSSHPQVLALLRQARESPEDDGARLVLADWLEDYGDDARAEFIRLQVRLIHEPASNDTKQRCASTIQGEELLARFGGAWLGSLWQLWMSPLRWHRGLLTVKLPPSTQASRITDALPWIDTLHFKITSRRTLTDAVTVLAQTEVNHISFELRLPLAPEVLLAELALLPESSFLRTLSFEWPLRMLRHWTCPDTDNVIGAEPNVDVGFLEQLLRECPLGRHLTHLGSSVAFNGEQSQHIREMHIEPVYVPHPLWMHSVPARCFRDKKPK
jgi:uncharacterized protein (TIGR02996 family)